MKPLPIELKVVVGLSVSLVLLFLLSWIAEFWPHPGHPFWRHYHSDPASYDAAKDALGFMKDWATWMAGIQVLMLAALGNAAKEGKLPAKQRLLAVISAVFSGFGLIVTAWTLSGIPSLLVRLQPNCPKENFNRPECDFYNLPFMTLDIAPPYTFFGTWQHMLWGAGMFAFAGFVICSILERQEVEQLDAV